MSYVSRNAFTGDFAAARPAMRWHSFLSCLGLAAFVLFLPIVVSAEELNASAERLFVRQVLPTFRTKCYACHGDDPANLRGEFRMVRRADLLQGGESGEAAIVVGSAEESPLYLAVRWEGLEMPPKENDRLSQEQIDAIGNWIDAGAPWPSDERIAAIIRELEGTLDNEVRVATSGGLSTDWTNRTYEPSDLWAYQPLADTDTSAMTSADIDRLVEKRLHELGLQPAPLADRTTLIRRATFDLTGLPPTVAEVEAFVADPASDSDAFATVVERLLASPHFGEQYGRHWLDVVRYADSSGYANDFERGNAWRYRDYVIRSLNADKPYDQFVREQIAGDELSPQDPELLIATGFLRMGPWELTAMEVPKVARQRFLDDVTDAVGQVFLGHMLRCASCHDHKFDPVPTRDYYSIQAVFATTQLAERRAPFLPTENTQGFSEREIFKQRLQDHQQSLKQIHQKSKDEFEPRDFGMERVARKGIQRLAWHLEQYEPYALSVYNGRTPHRTAVMKPVRVPKQAADDGELERTCVLIGGDPFRPGDPVAPAVLSVVALRGSTPPAESSGKARWELPTTLAGRRLALAEWIVDPQNPLTARVMANRLWQWHFGQAIAGNPNNFGATGKKPSHPELLDMLASYFVQHDWSMKSMHRWIMNSETYRRSAQHPSPEKLTESDPLGISYAAFQPRRLTAEELRDAMLFVSGELNPATGGIPIRPEMNLEAALQPRMVMGTFAEAWQPSRRPEERHRRSIYALKLRGLRDPFQEVFNAPSPDLSCESRDASTVTPQVFAMFNSEASYDRAIALALRLAEEDNPLQRLFETVFCRQPTAEELAACQQHWSAMTSRHEALTFQPPNYPTEVVREALEENTGVKFTYVEPLEFYEDFVPDRKPSDVSPRIRGLAEVCLVLLNTNEFAYVY